MPLWMVATPIGNLEDVSPRTKRVLAEASAILCEDTRRTRELLAALELDTDPKRLHRLDQHVARGKPQALERWLVALREGKSLAVVSDAGTPAVSDPGAELARRALEGGLEVSPVPGPSAFAAIVASAGFLGNRLVFEGFFPRDKSAVEELGDALARFPRPALVVFFESPARVGETAALIAEQADAWRVARVVFAKELTKRHERVLAGAPAETAEQVRAELERGGERGEWTLAIELSDSSAYQKTTENPDENWQKALRCVLAGGVSASQAAKIVSQEFGVKKKPVYSSALEISAEISYKIIEKK